MGSYLNLEMFISALGDELFWILIDVYSKGLGLKVITWCIYFSGAVWICILGGSGLEITIESAILGEYCLEIFKGGTFIDASSTCGTLCLGLVENSTPFTEIGLTILLG